jgi:hypothetical protein
MWSVKGMGDRGTVGDNENVRVQERCCMAGGAQLCDEPAVLTGEPGDRESQDP